ncbi:MAG: Acetyltransferase [Nitrospira sp.]|nr:MAG: Acetyltransferase [Nitrospira sp.]
MHVDVSFCPSPHSRLNQLGRVLWGIIWVIFYRPSPRIAHGWRRFILRLFGAKIGINAHPYPSAKIWAPWNLEMGEHSCLSEKVDCYSVNRIRLGPHAVVSQYSFLCTASHDYTVPTMPLITAPIIVEAGAWVAADVFVGPGVTIGEGAVVGARSTVIRNVEPWLVVAGNPVRVIRKRELSCGLATPAEDPS